MKDQVMSGSLAIKRVALSFSLCFLAACPLAALYTGEWGQVLPGFARILFSPCPLVTDYYRLGSLASAFLNAGLCGLACAALMYFTGHDCTGSFWAGYFLVIAHCFYGLNFINMWPPILGILLYCRWAKISFGDNLDIAMFSTAFGPFISELLFRYPLEERWILRFGWVQLNLAGVVFALLLGVFLGFAIPAVLPATHLLHRGYNLYNGGLAFGILGMLIYAFLYRTMGIVPPAPAAPENAVYDAHGGSYLLFANLFFAVVFLAFWGIGWKYNGRSFAGYKKLLSDTGYRTDFLQKYTAPCVLINLGLYGFLMLFYFDAVVLLTDGAGFTGPTCGVIIAAMTFAATGQHPKNVWPILAGYVSLSVLVWGIFLLLGKPLPWTLSTQGYINGVAFATGLCPFAGCYGPVVGVIAGAICAAMCTTTGLMHGGFVLYNGGLTAGITAIILTALLDHYYRGPVRK